jgi:hypothetical protein
MTHDTSIRGMTIEECRMLAKVMGYTEKALDHYCGRYAKIRVETIRYRGEKFTIGHMPVVERCPFEAMVGER